MKKQTLLTLIIALATSMSVNAQTIALHSSSGVQIIKGNTALATAYTAAQNGDTLYLSGGNFTPPAIIDKQLTIFGAGHYVDSTLATGKTFINGVLQFGGNADQTYLEGFEINGNLSFTTDSSLNNVTIKRCKINGNIDIAGNLSHPSSNLALIGNVFMGQVNIANTTNVMIANNIFSSVLRNTNGNLINNNLFLGWADYGYYNYFVFSGDNNIFNNNIYLAPNNYFAIGSGNIINKNLFVSAAPNYGTTPTVIDNYTGISQTTIFVNQTGNTFNYAHNYHLQSPAIYVGTDGTQIGIYGGSFPYKEGAVPLNPHIQIKNIAPTTDANGDLQIQIQVEAQND